MNPKLDDAQFTFELVERLRVDTANCQQE